MDQVKIGRFIAARRKAAGMTQMQLAERLNITDRAVSKWETGRSLPDSSIMLELCGLLNITVNDLLSGEVVKMEVNQREMERNLLEVVRAKEEADKRLLTMEIVVGALSTLILLGLVLTASYVQMPDWMRVTLIAGGLIPFSIGMFFCLKAEQTAGYYRCAHCGHRYVPAFGSVLWAMHVNRTRYMRCPECGRKTWQKKVLSRK